MSETESERAALLACARSYLEWEAELTGVGLPPHEARVGRAVAARVGEIAVVDGAVGAFAASTASSSTSTFTSPTATTSTTMLTTESTPMGGSRSVVGPGERRLRLAALAEEVSGCTRCELAKGRTQTVFARGNPDSPVVFIGEGPGQEEDRLGSPFVGPAGQLLDKMIAAMGFARDDVYICNVVKCRPPGNRTPLASEGAACSPYLLGQLDVVRPRVIVALGRCATENLGLAEGGGWRGRWGKFRGVDVMPTYHPAFLLRSPEYKRPVWEDLQKVMSKLKEP